VKLKLIYGDCLEKMKNIPGGSIDLVLTDPPYGTTPLQWDNVLDFKTMWNKLFHLIKSTTPVCIFGQEPFSSFLRLSNIEQYRYDWYWQKERLTNVFQVKRRPGKVIENISVFYQEQCNYFPMKTKYDGPPRKNQFLHGRFSKTIKNNSNVNPIKYEDPMVRWPLQIQSFAREIGNNLHPTQKPVALLEYLIKTYTNENETVLDFAAGSFSTAIACINTNRSFIGIEKDPEYFKIGKRRVMEHLQKQKGCYG
jgi:DNA modification methylase